MSPETLLIIRGFLLILGLTALYRVGVENHLFKKALAWFVFQMTLVGLWLSASYPFYHGQPNPFPQVIAFLALLSSIGILSVMLIFAAGVSRRQNAWKNEKKSGEAA